MSELEDKFDKAIDEAHFNFLEITGFQKIPMLAVKAGIAIGYRLALDDIQKGGSDV